MDLSFWKYKAQTPHQDQLVYERACCEGLAVEGLEALPIGDILQAVATAFGDWTALEPGRVYEKEGHGAFELFTTEQIVRIDCYGMKEADINAFIDVLLGYGCPVYDPQIRTRFDGWTDC